MDLSNLRPSQNVEDRSVDPSIIELLMSWFGQSLPTSDPVPQGTGFRRGHRRDATSMTSFDPTELSPIGQQLTQSIRDWASRQPPPAYAGRHRYRPPAGPFGLLLGMSNGDQEY
jgi:hypothetical protein